MNFLITFISFFIFLFTLYFLSRDDFVLLRKDISLEKVFNMAILVIFGSIFFSRLIYTVLDGSLNFLNPLIFFSWVKYPGFSLAGGVVGGIGVLLFLLRLKKMPLARLFDFFAISFLSGWGVLGIFTFRHISFFLLYVVTFVIFTRVLLPKLFNGKIREGMLGLLFMVSFSTISLISNFIPQGKEGFKFNLNGEDFILMLILIVSLVFIAFQKKSFLKLKKLLWIRK